MDAPSITLVLDSALYDFWSVWEQDFIFLRKLWWNSGGIDAIFSRQNGYDDVIKLQKDLSKISFPTFRMEMKFEFKRCSQVL